MITLSHLLSENNHAHDHHDGGNKWECSAKKCSQGKTNDDSSVIVDNINMIVRSQQQVFVPSRNQVCIILTTEILSIIAILIVLVTLLAFVVVFIISIIN